MMLMRFKWFAGSQIEKLLQAGFYVVKHVAHCHKQRSTVVYTRTIIVATYCERHQNRNIGSVSLKVVISFVTVTAAKVV